MCYPWQERGEYGARVKGNKYVGGTRIGHLVRLSLTMTVVMVVVQSKA